MKKTIGVALLVLWTQGVGYAEEMKIAFVDAQAVLNSTKEGGRIRQVLDEFVKARQAVIDLDEKELNRLNDELEKVRSLLSDEAIRVKQNEIDKAVNRYREKVTGLQKEVQEKRMSALAEFNQKLEQATKETADKDGYGMVFDKNPDRGIILYVKTTHDITAKVIQTLDSLFSKTKTDQGAQTGGGK